MLNMPKDLASPQLGMPQSNAGDRVKCVMASGHVLETTFKNKYLEMLASVWQSSLYQVNHPAKSNYKS